MAVEQAQDYYASITDDCRYSSSQEELLSHAKFAREDEIFPDDEEEPLPEVEDFLRKLDGAIDSERKRGGEFVAGDADNTGGENLGFRGERKRAREGESLEGTKLEGTCGEREIEPQLKKTRVIPLVHCSGKVVIEERDDGEKEKVIAVSGDLMVKIGNSSQSVVVPEGAGCTEKLDSGGFEDDGVEGEVKEESEVKKKLKFVTDTEGINLNDEEEIEGEVGEKGNVDKKEGKGRGEGSGIVEGDQEQGDGASVRGEGEDNATRRGKRELPPSMFGVVWGEGNGDGNGNGDVEGGLKEISGEGKREEESKGGEDVVSSGTSDKIGMIQRKGGEDVAFKCILDILRVIVASEECSNDNRDIDFLETAKRRGMTFPRSRFLPEIQEDQ